MSTKLDVYAFIRYVLHSLMYYRQWLVTEKLVYYGEYIVIVL
jgi:hypothetical protein